MLQEKDRFQEEQKDLWESDTRLQVKQSIRKISAAEGEKLWQEFEDFERQLHENGIRGYRAWFRYLVLLLMTIREGGSREARRASRGGL